MNGLESGPGGRGYYFQFESHLAATYAQDPSQCVEMGLGDLNEFIAGLEVDNPYVGQRVFLESSGPIIICGDQGTPPDASSTAFFAGPLLCHIDGFYPVLCKDQDERDRFDSLYLQLEVGEGEQAFKAVVDAEEVVGLELANPRNPFVHELSLLKDVIDQATHIQKLDSNRDAGDVVSGFVEKYLLRHSPILYASVELLFCQPTIVVGFDDRVREEADVYYENGCRVTDFEVNDEAIEGEDFRGKICGKVVGFAHNVPSSPDQAWQIQANIRLNQSHPLFVEKDYTQVCVNIEDISDGIIIGGRAFN